MNYLTTGAGDHALPEPDRAAEIYIEEIHLVLCGMGADHGLLRAAIDGTGQARVQSGKSDASEAIFAGCECFCGLRAAGRERKKEA